MSKSPKRSSGVGQRQTPISFNDSSSRSRPGACRPIGNSRCARLLASKPTNAVQHSFLVPDVKLARADVRNWTATPCGRFHCFALVCAVAPACPAPPVRGVPGRVFAERRRSRSTSNSDPSDDDFGCSRVGSARPGAMNRHRIGRCAGNLAVANVVRPVGVVANAAHSALLFASTNFLVRRKCRPSFGTRRRQ